MLKLIFVRHGDYILGADPSGKGLKDEGLERYARRHLVTLAEKLQGAGIKPDTIITSPLRRTMETAGVLSDEFKMDCAPQESIDLREGRMGGPFVSDQMKKLPGEFKTVMCVSHENAIFEEACALDDDNRIKLNYGNALIVTFDGDTWEDAHNPTYQIVAA